MTAEWLLVLTIFAGDGSYTGGKVKAGIMSEQQCWTQAKQDDKRVGMTYPPPQRHQWDCVPVRGGEAKALPKKAEPNV